MPSATELEARSIRAHRSRARAARAARWWLAAVVVSLGCWAGAMIVVWSSLR
jgi:hypothetical protein